MTIKEEKNVDIKKLVPNPNNPRHIKDDKFKKLVKSIKDFPEMLDARPIVVDEDMVVLGGNMRLKACISAGLTHVPIIKVSDISDEKKKEFIVKDNVGYGEWDFDILLEDYDKEILLDWGLDIPKGKASKDEIVNKLSDGFIVPPFSILDTRGGEWQERKKVWNEYLKEEGESREETLGKKTELTYGDISNRDSGPVQSMAPTVSLFDPVIAEVMFHWFAPEKSNIIDPFAGDIRKGAVASFVGHNFTGIELRTEQYEVNKKQIERLEVSNNLKYINDDGRNVDKHIEENSQDMIFSCPPYYDLEEYSDMENDASNQDTYEEFIAILDEAYTKAIKTLKDNRFAVVVVGDLRTKKDGYYYNFHEDIKFIFNKNGMPLYNELILIEMGGTAALRAGQLMTHRKTVKTHQNVLVFHKPESGKNPEIESVYRKVFVFHKGDPKEIKHNFKKIEYKNIDIPENNKDNDE
jgi:DNA modification methylase